MVSQTKIEVDKTVKMQEQIKSLNGTLNNAKGEYDEAMNYIRSRSKWTDMLLELQSMIPNTMFLVALEGQGTEVAAQAASDSHGQDMGLFGDSGGAPQQNAAPKEDLVSRKHAELITEVKELRLRFYTLTLPGEDLVDDAFKRRIKDSKFFDPNGFSILSYEDSGVKNGLKSYTVLLKLKEPIRK